MPLKLPPKVSPGQPVAAAHHNLLREAVSELDSKLRSATISGSADIGSRRTPGGTSLFLKRKERGRDTLPPFLPLLGSNGEGEERTYYVTVTPGYVSERDLVSGPSTDALFRHECPAQYDVEGNLAELPITSGQAVYVVVNELPSGEVGQAVGPSVDLLVAADGAESLNYIPGVQSGVYYYKLALFTITDGIPDLEIILGGSHIYHVSGLTCDVRILTCDPDNDPLTTGVGYAPAQLLRMSFLSGRVVAVGATVAARALAPIVEECNVSHCT